MKPSSFSPVLGCSLVLAVPLFALPQSAARFGQALSHADVNGDGFSDVIVGEPGHDGSSVDEGRVLVFLGSAAGPSSTPAWSRAGLQAGARFGATVAGLGDVNADGFEDVAVGAPDFDARRPGRVDRRDGTVHSDLFTDSGAFFVFLGSAGGLASAPALFRPGIQMTEHLGASLSRAGDVDGDGFDDVLVGATGTFGNRGVALLFRGSAAGPQALPAWIGQVPSLLPDTGYASTLTGGGDVNGDGFDDVVVGAPDARPDGRGAAFAYYGSPSGLPGLPSWTSGALATGDGPLDNGNSDWGATVSMAGDANGDGFDDLLLANPTYDGDGGHGSGQQYDTGLVIVIRGSSTGLGSSAAIRMTGSGGGFGMHAAGVGDVSGDGRGDAVLADTGIAGLAIVRYGSNQTWTGLSHIAGTDLQDGFGIGISSAGDIDGDGLGDLVISNPLVDRAGTDDGEVYVYRGTFGMLSGTPDWVLSAP